MEESMPPLPGEDDQPGPPVTTEPESGAPQHRWLTAGRVLVAVVSAAALVAVGVGWYTVERLRQNTNTTNALQQVSIQPDQPPANDGATDILLIGSDSRTDMQGNPLPASVLKQLRTEWDGGGVNTDTLIVLRIPNNGGPAYAVSIPRDSYVSIPGIGMNKINAAYGLTKAATEQRIATSGEANQAKVELAADQAGEAALIETVQNLTGVRIDHYAEVNLYGFYLISEAIGGVPICLKHATQDKDSGADFAAGYQLVSGANALSFVRQRKNLPDGDLDRILRQQVFLASAAKKLLSAGTLTNYGALTALVDAVKKSLVMDPGLDILSFLQQAQSLAAGNVTFETIPVITANGRSPTGQSIVAVDTTAVHQFFTDLVNSSSAPTTASATRSTSASVPGTAMSTTPTSAPTSAPTSTPPAAGPSTAAAPVPAPAAAPSPAAIPPVSINGVRCVD